MGWIGTQPVPTLSAHPNQAVGDLLNHPLARGSRGGSAPAVETIVTTAKGISGFSPGVLPSAHCSGPRGGGQ